MRAISFVARRHVARLLASWPVILAIGVLVVLTTLSTAMGLREFEFKLDQNEQLIQQLVQEQIKRLPLGGFQNEPTLRVIRSPSPSSVVVRGADVAAPAYWDFGPSGVTPASSLGAGVSHADIGPTMDIEFLGRTLLALLALVLSVEAIQLVQAHGELSGFRGLPVTLRQLWIGQMIGVNVLMTLCWVLMVSASLGAIVVLGPMDAFGPAGRALGHMTVPLLTYSLLMTGIGAVAATLGRRPRTTYLVVFVSWLAITVLAPPLLIGLARLVRPVPPLPIMTTNRTKAFERAIQFGENTLGDALLAFQKLVPTSNQRDVDPMFYPTLDVLWAPHAHEARVRSKSIDEEWQASQDDQDRLLRALEWGSPASMFWRAASDAAGSGPTQQASWNRQIAAHNVALQQALFDNRPRVNLRTPADRGHQVFFVTRHRAQRYSDLPAFDINRLDQSGREEWSIIAMLATYSALAAGFGIWRFARTSSKI